MLPSFRLIAATFLCGFLVVFAGLKLAASLNDMHEGLPVMAAHAAPTSIVPAADRETQRGLLAAPVMYDLRFAVSTVAPTLVRVAPTVLERSALPLAILPPEDVAKEAPLAATPEAEAAKPEAAVAAIQFEAPVIETPAEVTDAPKAPAASWPAAEAPPAADKSAAIEPLAALGTEEPLTNSEADTAAVEPPSDPVPVAEPEQAPSQVTVPAPRPRAAKSARHAKAKVVQKKRIRTAHRAAQASPFGRSPSAFGTPGLPQQR
jgi:hypothetical protein